MATLPAQPALDRSVILLQAHKLLNKKAFSKEDSARVESLLSLADSLDGRETLKYELIRQSASLDCRPRLQIDQISSQPDS